jgi:hypothetical protein
MFKQHNGSWRPGALPGLALGAGERSDQTRRRTAVKLCASGKIKDGFSWLLTYKEIYYFIFMIF